MSDRIFTIRCGNPECIERLTTDMRCGDNCCGECGKKLPHRVWEELLDLAFLYAELIQQFVAGEDVGEMAKSPMATWLVFWNVLETLPESLLRFVFRPKYSQSAQAQLAMLGLKLAEKLGVNNALLPSDQWKV